jgi:5-oxoprolinase (ATP-hydrolysing) subunit A
MYIDLNADVGESFGRWTLGNDAEVMKHITSANVACGFHAGDPGVMRETVRIARAAAVAIGAHPGFPDLVGFGRRDIVASPREVEDFVLYQVGALAAIAAAEGVRLQHVKAHGALYNMAVRDRRPPDAV